MPYINAELKKRKRLSIKNYGHDVEINEQEDVVTRLSYSSDLTLQEVTTWLKSVAGLPNIRSEREGMRSQATNDPEIPYFKKMEVVARKVSRPYLVHDSHRHRAQRVILSNGYAQYET